MTVNGVRRGRDGCSTRLQTALRAVEHQNYRRQVDPLELNLTISRDIPRSREQAPTFLMFYDGREATDQASVKLGHDPDALFSENSRMTRARQTIRAST